MSNLSENYREIMKKNGLTQQKVADMLGYAGQATVGKYLKYGITLRNIYDLAKALGYDMVIVKRNGKGKIVEEYDLEV